MIRKRVLRGIALALAAALVVSLCACGGKEPDPAPQPAPEQEDTEEPEEPEEEEDQIAQLVAGMTTEEKLTQMMIIAFRGESGDAEDVAPYAEILEKYDFGGAILFTDSIIDIPQTVAFTRGCQEAALGSRMGIPMLICVDQEGGMVNRVSFGTTGSGNMALAAAGDVSLAEESARTLGGEIAALGFNMDFAPVSDVNSNPANPIIGVRSFSDDPEMAAEYVKAFIRGLDEAGISSALKHFPGHGNVGEDSHTGLPCSEFTLEQIRACDLIPFQAGIAQGTDMIMTAHIQFPEIETETYVSVADGQEVYLPATLSRTIITGLLREEMGYDGIVITDALDMGAITTHFDRLDAASMAINAGVDLLLCPVNVYEDAEGDTFADVDAYVAGLAERVESGEISEAELDDSVYRILKLKQEKGLMPGMELESLDDLVARAEQVVGTPENHTREWEIAQQGMTLLKNDGGALPLDGSLATLILYPSEYRRPAVDYAVSRLEGEGLLDASQVTEVCYLELEYVDEPTRQAVGEADQIILLSIATYRDPALAGVIDLARAEGKPVVLLSANLPYDVACYENADAFLCGYQPYGSAHDAEGNGPFNLNIAVLVCTAFGESVPAGTLPVNVPRVAVSGMDATFLDELLYERGDGLQNWGE